MPVFNEEANLDTAIRQTLVALDDYTDEFEIIVINDGSTDRTGAIADQLAAGEPRIHVVHNEQNMNYGYVLKRGFELAHYDWISHNGADLPFAPEDIEKFTAHFPHADVVVACRTSRAAHSPWRKLTSWTHNRLICLLFSPQVADLNFVQFYRRSYVQSVQICSTSPAFITPELILRAEHTGKRVRTVTVEFQRREAGTAHFGKLNDILWSLKDMLRLRYQTLLWGWKS